jgi:hypothetical protein
MPPKKNQDLTIDDYLKSLGARWRNESERNGLIVSQDGFGHFSVRMADVVKPDSDQGDESEDSAASTSAVG